MLSEEDSYTDLEPHYTLSDEWTGERALEATPCICSRPLHDGEGSCAKCGRDTI